VKALSRLLERFVHAYRIALFVVSMKVTLRGWWNK
jgi:hypothetical protein